MYQSTDEDTTNLKDRERQRLNATNARQTLGAVGRVASKVRHSSVLTKANSLLQRQKEGKLARVNESPWGVGTSVAVREQKHPSEESRQSNEEYEQHILPRAGRRSDMVDLSSPLSAERHSSTRLPEVNAKEEDSPRNSRTNDGMGNDRIGSSRKTEKKKERTSGLLGAAGGNRGLVKSVSRFGIRSNDRKSTNQSSSNSLAKTSSMMGIQFNNLKEAKSSRKQMGKGTSDVLEDANQRHVIAIDHDISTSLLETEAMPDTRLRGFHLPGMARSKFKPDDLLSKARAGEKLKTEKTKAKSGLAKSISQMAIVSPKATSSGKESQANGPDSESSDDGTRSRGRIRKGRASWFVFSGDSADGQLRGMGSQSRSRPRTRTERGSGGDGQMRVTRSRSRSRSRTRQERGTTDNDAECELQTRNSVKTSKDLAEIQDFAIDEYFDSEEDDMESESAPVSLVKDDFISYQTGKGKKSQGNRSKIRMKPQT